MHFVHSSSHPAWPREEGLKPAVGSKVHLNFISLYFIWNRSHCVAQAGIEFTHCGLRLQATTVYQQAELPRGRNSNYTWG